MGRWASCKYDEVWAVCDERGGGGEGVFISERAVESIEPHCAGFDCEKGRFGRWWIRRIGGRGPGWDLDRGHFGDWLVSVGGFLWRFSILMTLEGPALRWKIEGSGK